MRCAARVKNLSKNKQKCGDWGDYDHTAAARQQRRGYCPFRGEWEHTPCFFWRAHALRSSNQNKNCCAVAAAAQ
jgi:hypothetical protein